MSAVSVIRRPSSPIRTVASRVRRLSLDPYALLLCALSLLALGPMLQAGYFWGAHDARHSVYFLFEFDRVFQDGIWYPRWFPDMTFLFGYPLFNIYGPLAFYAGEFFHLLGADLVTSVKLVFALAWVLSGLAMYGFIFWLFGSRPAAFVSGLAFVFMPYHLEDVYVRAALAESVALVFLPLTLWGFYETVVAPRARAILFAAFAYSGMVFAHNGIGLLFSPVLAAWILFLLVRRVAATRPVRFMSRDSLRAFVRDGLPSAAGLVLGLTLTGIFLLPLALEYRYVNVSQWTANYYDYAEHFVEFFQLFDPTWGFGISQPGPHDGLSFQFGLVPFLLAVLSLVAVARNPRGLRPHILFFLVVTFVVTLLMFDFSLPLWKLVGLASVAQFPWRLLTLTTLSLSVLAGAVLLVPAERAADERPGGAPAGLGLALPALAIGGLILLGSYPYITAQNLAKPKEGPVGLVGFMRFQSSAKEMIGSTAFASKQLPWSALADNAVAGKKINTKIDLSEKPDSLYIGPVKGGLRTNGEVFGVNAQDDQTPITFYVQYYPGWHAYLLKKGSSEIIQELPITIQQPYGQIRIAVPKGEHKVLLRFEDTPPRTIGTILSGLSLLFAAGLYGWDAWRRRARR
ncbi:MAG: 6-pyruvoyl-tetrahydropterin synthase-related protein [Rudaea sp.]